jgi:hypothetical protein
VTPWYTKHLKGFGMSLMIFGFAFFALVYPTGAPVVPWSGLVLAFAGAWIGFSKGPESKDPETKVAKPGNPE